MYIICKKKEFMQTKSKYENICQNRLDSAQRDKPSIMEWDIQCTNIIFWCHVDNLYLGLVLKDKILKIEKNEKNTIIEAQGADF